MATGISPTASVSNQYYPLPERRPGANSISRARDTDAAYPAYSFDRLLNIGGTSSSSVFGVEDFVDLSPQAQDFIDFFNGAASGFAGSPVLEDSSIILTDAQQAQISAIILQFRDAPFTVDTYRDIKRALEDAGLSPEQIAVQNAAASPLTITQLFLRALGAEEQGTSNNILTFDSQSTRDTSDAYTRMIFAEWERISTQFRPPLIANFIQPPVTLRREDELV